MATRKRSQRSMSHPLEVQREIYALEDAKCRLLGIADALRTCDPNTTLTAPGSALREVLRRAVAGEAHSLATIATRFNGQLGPDAVKLNGGA